ncbi:hypothetical protein E2C01_012910 [Portunus trituberculatus]|uniref:Uncharacterized protein n=1 Tax=Portunus trituberculatus TaxID=210409 RepID=A0A5B7DEX6_PORTR|nr:hypothetical protein [Portunus trituberculatus]
MHSPSSEAQVGIDGVMFITGSLQSREDDSGISGTTLSTTAHSAFSSGSSKRTCVHQECSRALPNISHDPHTVCITCFWFLYCFFP